MEKLKHSISLTALTAFFRSIMTESVQSILLWRIILGGVLTVAVVMGVVAWFAYVWATEEPAPRPISKEKQNTLSIERLQGVIASYRERDDEYKKLLYTTPDAPALGVGSGVQ